MCEITLSAELVNTDCNSVTLDNITGRALHKVMEYCTMHSNAKAQDLKSWDEKFVKLDPGTLCELASVSLTLFICLPFFTLNSLCLVTGYRFCCVGLLLYLPIRVLHSN
jgi:hypothetical protein